MKAIIKTFAIQLNELNEDFELKPSDYYTIINDDDTLDSVTKIVNTDVVTNKGLGKQNKFVELYNNIPKEYGYQIALINIPAKAIQVFFKHPVDDYKNGTIFVLEQWDYLQSEYNSLKEFILVV
jgi:hypothetical protein